MNMPNFAQAGQQLDGLRQQQSELAAAVESGQLWMEPDVAERAAARCEQAVDELHAWLDDTRALTERRKFGANEDGEAAASRFSQAGQEYVGVMTNARNVFQRMADTYRAAGRAAAQAEESNQQMFGSGSS